MTSSWLLPETALEQRGLVLRQLQHPESVAPFSIFLEAMRFVSPDSETLLDCGCGTGHYGELLSRFHPSIRYYGTDFSPAMIAETRGIDFNVCAFEDNDFGSYDIVLLSQVMEYTQSPWASLEMVLDKVKGDLILHRLRVTSERSHADFIEGYGGRTEQNYVWNIADVLALIGNRLVKRFDWEFMTTLVVGRKHDE